MKVYNNNNQLELPLKIINVDKSYAANEDVCVN